eukprot:scpid91906/ scgid18904/ 
MAELNMLPTAMVEICGEKFYELHMGCPATNCLNVSNRYVVQGIWISKDCQGLMHIGQKGNLCCNHHSATHPCVYGPLNGFRFDCSLRSQDSPHSHQEPFVEGNRHTFCHALGSGFAMSYLGSLDDAWVKELLAAIDKQFSPSASLQRTVRMTLGFVPKKEEKK